MARDFNLGGVPGFSGANGPMTITIKVVLHPDHRTLVWSQSALVWAKSVKDAKNGDYLESGAAPNAEKGTRGYEPITWDGQQLLAHLQNVKEGDALVFGAQTEQPACGQEVIDVFLNEDGKSFSRWDSQYIAVKCP